MSKITLSTPASLTAETAALTTIGNNNAAITTAMDNTLSRDGTSPNSMSADLDMNSKKIINLGAPTNGNDGVRLTDLQAVTGLTAVATLNAAVASAQTAATSATTSASNAATSATSATTLAASAASSATNAAASAASITAAGYFSNTRVSITGSSSIGTSGNEGKTLSLTYNGAGAVNFISFGAPSGYTSNFNCLVVNEGTRGWTINLSGISSIILWPGQSIFVFKRAASPQAWDYYPKFQRYTPGSAVTVYVNASSGSDSSDGLATGTGAFLTVQAAYNAVRTLMDHRSIPPTIQLEDGTHNVNGGVNITYDMFGGNQVYINGNLSTPANVVVQCNAATNCFLVREPGAIVTLSGMKLRTIGNQSILLTVSQGGVCDLAQAGPVIFDAAPLGGHINVDSGGFVNFLGNYNIIGSAPSHISAVNNSFVSYGGNYTCTGSSSLAFTNFLSASTGSMITASLPMNFSGFGSVTGSKYVSAYYAIIQSAGATFPGDAAGSLVAGGVYI